MRGQLYIGFAVIFVVLSIILASGWFRLHKTHTDYTVEMLSNIKSEYIGMVEYSLLYTGLEKNMNEFTRFLQERLKALGITFHAIYSFSNGTDIVIGNWLADSINNVIISVTDNSGPHIYTVSSIAPASSTQVAASTSGPYAVNITYNIGGQQKSINYAAAAGSSAVSIEISLDASSSLKGSDQFTIERKVLV